MYVYVLNSLQLSYSFCFGGYVCYGDGVVTPLRTSIFCPVWLH